MANSFDLSNLTKYTDELSQSLVNTTIMAPKTMNLVTVVQGVKYKTALKTISANPIFQAANCTFAANGASTLLNRDIQVCPIKVEDKICLSDLEQYWPGQFMKAAGSQNEDMPREVAEAYLKEQGQQIAKNIEKLFWQGDTTIVGSTNNMNKCDGLIKILNAESGVIDYGTTSGSPLQRVALTSGNAISTVNAMVALIPEDILEAEDLTMFMSSANYQTLIQAYFNDNKYHFDVTGARAAGEFMLPTSPVKVVRIAGLSGNFQIVLTPASNIAFGTDLQSDTDSFKLFYDEKDDAVLFRAKWKQGAQVYFPGYVVLYSGVPA